MELQNDIRNQIIFKGEDISRHIQKYLSFDNAGDMYFDFEKILPTPTDLKIKEDNNMTLGIQYFLNCKHELLPLKDSELQQIYDNDLVQNRYLVEDTNKIYNTFWSKKGSTRAKILEQGIKGIMNILHYGYPSDYLWHIKNWGSSQNSTNAKFNFANKDECSITFDTFSLAPFGIVEHLCKTYNNIDIKAQYGSSIFGRRCGVMFTDNDNLYQITYNDFTKESYDIAIDLYGCPKQLTFNKETNNYEWME